MYTKRIKKRCSAKVYTPITKTEYTRANVTLAEIDSVEMGIGQYLIWRKRQTSAGGKGKCTLLVETRI